MLLPSYPIPEPSRGVATKDVVINTNTHLSVRLFLPQIPSISCEQAAEEGKAATAQKIPVLIFFHGGGFMYCSPRLYAYDTFCRRLAKMAGYLVVSVDYRRTPEVSFPVPFLDSLEAVAWVAKQTGCEAMQADGAEAAVAARLAQLAGKGGAEMIENLSKGRFVPPNAGSASDPLVEKVVNMEAMIGAGPEPWLSAHGDPSRVLIMGDSAGGNVVHNTMLLYLQAFAPFFSGAFVPSMSASPVLRPEQGNVQGVAALDASADAASTWAGEAPPPPPASMRTVNMFGLNVRGNVLLYPFFGSHERQPGEIRNRYNLTFNMANTDHMWRLILPQGATRDHYISNPSKLEDKSLLALFPPSLVVVSSEDILHDHGVAYHRLMKSREAGFSDCKILRFESVHDFVVIFPHLRDTERCFGALFYFMEAHK